MLNNRHRDPATLQREVLEGAGLQEDRGTRAGSEPSHQGSVPAEPRWFWSGGLSPRRSPSMGFRASASPPVHSRWDRRHRSTPHTPCLAELASSERPRFGLGSAPPWSLGLSGQGPMISPRATLAPPALNARAAMTLRASVQTAPSLVGGAAEPETARASRGRGACSPWGLLSYATTTIHQSYWPSHIRGGGLPYRWRSPKRVTRTIVPSLESSTHLHKASSSANRNWTGSRKDTPVIPPATGTPIPLTRIKANLFTA